MQTNRPTLSQRDISGGSGDSVAITGPQLPPTKKSVRSDGHASNRPVGLVDRSDSAISGMVAELSTSSLNEQMLTTAYHNTESLASLKSENDGSLASKSNSFRRSGDSRHRHNSNNSISSRDGASSTSGNVANAPPARAIKDLERLRLEIGLENLGNTCFMNSSLQCLLHIRPLAKFFLEEDLSKLVNVRSPMRGQLATSFAYLVRDVCDARDGTYISPLNFVKAVSLKRDKHLALDGYYMLTLTECVLLRLAFTHPICWISSSKIVKNSFDFCSMACQKIFVAKTSTMRSHLQ